jgi:hypothetical protein
MLTLSIMVLRIIRAEGHEMGGTKTRILVPIQQTRCGSCALLESAYVITPKGRIRKAFKCPRNRVLPTKLEPFFAEKCRLFKAVEGS